MPQPLTRQRRIAEDFFFRLIGHTARSHSASLYYPAAGLDLQSFLRTSISHAVFLDPRYFHASRMDQRSIKRAVRMIDASASFVRRSQRILSARFGSSGHPRTVTFIRGAAGSDEPLVARYTQGKVVVLMRGCLLPKVLCPPQTIQGLAPVAFALVLLDVPTFSATIRRAYSEPLLDLRSPPSRLLIFGRYRYMPDRRRRAQEQLNALLANARSGPKR